MATDDRNRPAAPHSAPAKRGFFGELINKIAVPQIRDRLTDAIVRPGATANIRRAGSPTRVFPSAGQCTTDGTSRCPAPSAKRMGNPESTTPTKEVVVPKSMPTIIPAHLRRVWGGLQGADT
jgi:hypothetical protein